MRRTTFTTAIALLTVMAGPSALAQAPFGIGEGGISIVFDGNNNAISVNALQQVTTNGSPSGFSIGPGGIAIGGPFGVVVESGMTIGGGADFDAVFGAPPAATLGDATGN